MKRLVSRFQEKLEVSRKDAENRAVAFVGILILCVVLLIYWIATFPYQNSTEKASLLPGEYKEVEEVLKENADVSVNRSDFLQLAEDKPGFVSLYSDGDEISAHYLIRTDGLSYHYEQEIVSLPAPSRRSIGSCRIEEGSVIVEKGTDFIHAVVLPLLFLFILLLIMFRIQFRKMGWNRFKEVYI